MKSIGPFRSQVLLSFSKLNAPSRLGFRGRPEKRDGGRSLGRLNPAQFLAADSWRGLGALQIAFQQRSSQCANYSLL